eukprot:TRINITY_DN1191_c0_g1_i19.p1 TRINITY_DN1191_c0_g1~~TRINITY_DN1191_c0_g1_i19.p1  ORF type:complete len:164 (+),score=14.88 TRINITY_DN1191_c0_g1_i19:353-844(+)
MKTPERLVAPMNAAVRHARRTQLAQAAAAVGVNGVSTLGEDSQAALANTFNTSAANACDAHSVEQECPEVDRERCHVPLACQAAKREQDREHRHTSSVGFACMLHRNRALTTARHPHNVMPPPETQCARPPCTESCTSLDPQCDIFWVFGCLTQPSHMLDKSK